MKRAAAERIDEEPRTASTVRARSNPVLAAMRLIPLAAWTMFCLVADLLYVALAPGPGSKYAVAQCWTHRWFKVGAWIMGIRVRPSGPMPPAGSLVAPNHLGYADIIAVGSVLPTIFVAKAEVASWPVIGFLFRSGRHVGVPRSRSRALAGAAEQVEDRLRYGATVCVFLEGTSTGGDRVRAFHGTMLQPAMSAGAPVVPVALRWSARQPGVSVSEDVAYWKDHTFVPHFWRLLGLRGVTVNVRFGQAIPPNSADRKTLAETARAEVIRLLDGGAMGLSSGTD